MNFCNGMVVALLHRLEHGRISSVCSRVETDREDPVRRNDLAEVEIPNRKDVKKTSSRFNTF